MKDKDNWQEICEEIQDRVWKATPHTLTNAKIKNSKTLRAEILKCLNNAHDQGKLKTKVHEIRHLLQRCKSETNGSNIYEITGGQRNFKRLREKPHFEKYDTSWFDFAILIDETPKPAAIIGFNFEIRFPDNCPTKFIRYDLNLPSHNNEQKGMRFHLHPGNDDFMIHSPPMSPLEILNLFLFGLEIPQRPRSK